MILSFSRHEWIDFIQQPKMIFSYHTGLLESFMQYDLLYHTALIQRDYLHAFAYPFPALLIGQCAVCLRAL